MMCFIVKVLAESPMLARVEMCLLLWVKMVYCFFEDESGCFRNIDFGPISLSHREGGKSFFSKTSRVTVFPTRK